MGLLDHAKPPFIRQTEVSPPASPHSDPIDDHIDVPARRLRVRAGLVRSVGLARLQQFVDSSHDELLAGAAQ
jgi:hypothetical protein